MLSKSITKKFDRRKGFSLIELLVVIVIILILLSLTLPLVLKIKAHAHGVACTSNLRQISLLVFMYARHNKGYLPHEDNGNSRPPFGCGWYVVLKKRSTPDEIFHCPSEPDQEARSYKMNSWLEDEATPFVRLGGIQPRNLVLFFDGRVNNRGVRKLPKGTWRTADNRHPDGTHYLTLSGEVNSYDSDSGRTGWEDDGGLQWKPKRR